MFSLKKIFSLTCLAISLFLLIYTFYKSEIYWDGSQSNYYLPYYIISFILIIFSIFTFYLNSKTKEYLIICLISIVVSLYAFEGYLFSKIYKIVTTYEKITGEKFDTRTKLEIYKDLKQINNKIQVTTGSIYHENNKLYALSGVSNSKTIRCNENGYYSIYESDRYGFNNPDNEWDKKKIEYLLVGDSFTNGYCVNRPNDIASVLRNLSNKSVLNLGQGGNGPLTEYATLREYLNPNVKKVLWIFYEENDFENLDSELTNEVLKNYLNNLTFTQNLRSRQNEIDSLTKALIEREIEKNIKGDHFEFNFIKFIKIYNTRVLLMHQPQLKTQPQQKFKTILKLAKDLSKKNNSKLYFIYLPEYIRYKNNYSDNSYLEVKKIVNELDIYFIDIHAEVFEKEENPLKLYPYGSNGHFNVEGYKKVAETIYRFTKD
mgnify:CR=1 FL=1|tara:strand:+ start:1175 stop:2467 length:1293 start_codon:yes stop_codon:yes gene_type:complete